MWHVDRSHKYKINQGVMVGGRLPVVEDNLLWILACCLLRFAAIFFCSEVEVGVELGNYPITFLFVCFL